MPNPKKALAEIRRVLKTNGLLFAPTFIHAGSKKAAILSQLMSLTVFAPIINGQ
jgi:ubiquinone/menaquinone biosynthesis C-methylase UbiE